MVVSLSACGSPSLLIQGRRWRAEEETQGLLKIQRKKGRCQQVKLENKSPVSEQQI